MSRQTNEDDLDDYINTFKLKSFDSDTEEEEIQKPSTNKKEIIKEINIPKNNTPVPVPDKKESNIDNTKKNIGNITNPPITNTFTTSVPNKVKPINPPPVFKPQIPIKKDNNEEVNIFDIVSSQDQNLFLLKKNEITTHKPVIQKQKETFIDDSFKSISNDYKSIFNLDVLSTKSIEREINKVAQEDQQIEILDLDINEPEPIAVTKPIIKPITKPITPMPSLTEDKLHKYKGNITINFQKNKILLVNKIKGSNLLKHESLTNLDTNDIDHLINSNYKPINYSLDFDADSSHKNLLTQIKTNIQNKTIKFCNNEAILIYLLNNYVTNKLNCNLLESSSQGMNARKDFLNFCKKLNILNFKKEESKKLFKLDKEDANTVDYSMNKILSKGLEKVLIECYNEKSGLNLFLFSLFAKKEDILMYMSTIFEEHPEYKEDEVYILFMIKSGNIQKLVNEKKDYLFKHFNLIFFLLIQNFEYFESQNVINFFNLMGKLEYSDTLKSFIISILNNFKSSNANRNYTQNITKFLDNCNLTKILMMDYFNYFVYRVTDNKDIETLEKIGFASILIKYKFTGLAYEMNKIDLVKDYGPKIYLNVNQFGAYSKSSYFRDYIRDAFNMNINNTKVQVISTNKTIETIKPKTKPKVEPVTNKSIFDEPSEKVEVKPTENKQGIGTFLISALGFGSNRPINSQVSRPKSPKTKTVEPVEEQQPQNDMYYDPIKKRWVLRGKIYDDEPDAKPVLAKEATLNKPVSIPPKISTIKPPKTEIISIVPPSTSASTGSKPDKNKISNPFAPKKEVTNSSSTSKPNLQNRYVNTIFDN